MYETITRKRKCRHMVWVPEQTGLWGNDVAEVLAMYPVQKVDSFIVIADNTWALSRSVLKQRSVFYGRDQIVRLDRSITYCCESAFSSSRLLSRRWLGWPDRRWAFEYSSVWAVGFRVSGGHRDWVDLSNGLLNKVAMCRSQEVHVKGHL